MKRTPLKRAPMKRGRAHRIPKIIRDAVQDRADGRCEICWKPANNAHHRRNQSQGGRDVLSNLGWLCGSGTTGCHGWVTEHPAAAELAGWTIQGTIAVPALVPVRRRGEKVWLTDEGDVLHSPPQPQLKAVRP